MRIMPMTIIKRYPNRKLYDTAAKQYVTLDGIAELIKQGEEVQIIDHQSGEDLTAVTLTQIIFEQEKKEGGFLPRSILTGLIQSSGQTLTGLKRTLASQLDLLQQVNQEIERRIQALVSAGDLDAEEGEALQAKLISMDQHGHGSEWPSDEELERILANRGVPSQADLNDLNDRLDRLVAKLDKLEANEE